MAERKYTGMKTAITRLPKLVNLTNTAVGWSALWLNDDEYRMKTAMTSE